MTQAPGEAFGQPAAPKKRGGVLLIIGAILLLIGVVALGLGIASTVSGAKGLVDSFQPLPVPGSVTVDAESGSGWRLYTPDGQLPDDVTVTVVGPDGGDIAMGNVFGNEEISGGQFSGSAARSFNADTDGTYTVTSTVAEGAATPSGYFLAPGVTDLAGGFAGGIGGVCLGAVVGIIGLVLLIIGLVLRLKS